MNAWIKTFFAERLAKLRIAKDVSARDMSLNLEQSENYINRIENKNTYSSMAVFFKICDYLNISPQEFFDVGTENPEQIRAIVDDLKRVAPSLLPHVGAVIRELGRK